MTSYAVGPVLLCTILLFAFSTSASVDYTFPKGAKICKRTESEYSNCLKNSLQESWSSLVQGVPALQMPILDPLKTDLVEHSLQAGVFSGHIKLRDVKIYGMSNTQFHEVRPQFSGNRIKIDAKIAIPKVFIECDYKADGAVDTFNVQIGGKGHFNISMTGLTAVYSLVGHVEDDKWVVEHFLVDPEITGMRVYFDDLLNGNKALNNAAITITNQYWPIFFQAMKPIIQALSDPHLTNFVNHYVFSQIPVSKLFPA